MDPILAALNAFVRAVQDPGTVQAPVQTLLDGLVGQDVNLLFLGAQEGGLLFQLPSGQTFQAQGSFPFPPGSQVLARFTADPAGVRLQTLQAQPPAPPALLAPLIQGEGTLLASRLLQAEPDPGLESLVRLFQALGGSSAGEDVSQSPVPSSPSAPPAGAASLDPGSARGEVPVGTPEGAAAPPPAPGTMGPTATPSAASDAGSGLPPGVPTPGASAPADSAPASPGMPASSAPATAAPAGQGTPASPSQPATDMPSAGQAPSPSAQASASAAPSGPAQPFPAQASASAAPPGPMQPLPAQTSASAPSAGPTQPLPAQASASAAPAGSAQPLATQPTLPSQPSVSVAANGTASLPAPAGGAAADDADLGTALVVLLRSVGAASPAPEALDALVRELPEAAQASLRSLVRNGVMDGGAVQQALQRLQTALVQRPDLQKGAEGLEQALRNLARPGEAQAAPAAPQAPASPETWEAWLRAGTRSLADPAVSPREAPFHAAQAREGTALFEVPLPWSPGSHLQMWVERDGGGRQGGSGTEGESRVLLGLNFSRLGETRLGIAKGSGGLQVRVWAEHAGLLAGARQSLEEELGTLGMPVDLRILPLEADAGGGVPSIRSLAMGATFQVLG
jgi:hypothetical protein